MQPKDLVGKDLKGFAVQELTEVYRLNEDGSAKAKSIGFFRDETIAKAFAQHQTDANFHKTTKEFLLTNGEVAFLLGESVTLFNDEKTVLEIKKRVLDKLTLEERKILGI